MALEATHIRFALDLKDKYKVVNLNEYILGTLYPDSRYVTDVERDLTHNRDILTKEFATTDFHKGWQAHQICDGLQQDTFYEMIEDLAKFDRNIYYGQKWIDFTAAKIICDMRDAQSFDIESIIKDLKYGYLPNSDDPQKMQTYLDLIKNLYLNKTKPNLEDYSTMWQGFGKTKETGDEIISKVNDFIKSGQAELICSTYENMVENVFEKYKETLGKTYFLN